jgi:peptidoglycan/LPS O-acetylase OafA/YrhL
MASGPSAAAGPNGYRDGNLDLLRACAVLSVVGYHVLQWSPVDPPWLDALGAYGAYGVDLFFVLSGYLIGGLYWREEYVTGRVAVRRFLSRRWFRTIPPYMAALILAWLAVRIVRGEPFDWRYLVFVQNYEPVIPFFLISWSLCVEEHFYLALPVLLGITRHVPKVRAGLLVLGMVIPLVGRWNNLDVGPGAPFGYHHTATHLYFEGLVAGVGLAWLRTFMPAAWHRLQSLAPWIVVPLTAAFVSVSLSSRGFAYVALPTVAALFFAAGLAALAGKKAVVPKALLSPVRGIALSSYSLYLVHPMLIHAGNEVNARSAVIGDWITLLLVWPSFIALGGGLFYLLVERGTLALREAVVPSAASRRNQPPTTKSAA